MTVSGGLAKTTRDFSALSDYRRVLCTMSCCRQVAVAENAQAIIGPDRGETRTEAAQPGNGVLQLLRVASEVCAGRARFSGALRLA